MANNPHGIAQSNYRQLRLTITHETGGRFSYSLYGKRLEAQWHEHQCLARGAEEGTRRPLNTTEDAIMAALVVLESLLLPADPARLR